MSNWGYTKADGPSTWGNVAPAALGKRQSPIDIVPSQAKYDSSLKDKPFKIEYTPGNAKSITNNGKSVTMAYDPSGSSLTGGPLRNKFQLAQFHFHWGTSNDCGSEHTVDGKMFASEAHLVHYNTDLFKDFGEAAQADNGLTVLGVFLKVGEKNHAGFQKVIDLVKSIPFADDTLEVKGGYDPSLLLPEDCSRYWTYLGSLTTPPCFESVNWVVFRDPIEVSQEQINVLRGISNQSRENANTNNGEVGVHLADGDYASGRLVNNYRPPVPLNDRQVISSFRKFFV
ncbi:hypothetical protein CAPTEDRAFT_224291 [Capitella teleta]|uniref:Carbonic anhydrase n=1 Tax=Capitella teleta TaxID=283909 RepID=R7T953_CAPTE|nr:hypothetical protein CAPTEDRAFT_224291 [Capitella teleta]|eukprot:ELT87930.1 hypothetical protein CAPTEDRAFT_224291 [Capitella teleta]